MTTSEGRETLERAVLWRGPTVGTLELFRLFHVRRTDGEGWQLKGTVTAQFNGELAEVLYSVDCDDAWRTRETTVNIKLPSRLDQITLMSAGTWTLRRLLPERGDAGTGEPAVAGARPDGARADLSGCADVDIGLTPSTNMLPIRRLSLAVGESAEVTAAWVRFPELTVEPLAQRYTRLDERRYRYESASGFAAELEVDELGLVVRYGDLWERVGG